MEFRAFVSGPFARKPDVGPFRKIVGVAPAMRARSVRQRPRVVEGRSGRVGAVGVRRPVERRDLPRSVASA